MFCNIPKVILSCFLLLFHEVRAKYWIGVQLNYKLITKANGKIHSYYFRTRTMLFVHLLFALLTVKF